MKYLKIIIILVVAISIVLSSCVNHEEITINSINTLKQKLLYIPIVFLGCMAIATLLELLTSYI